MNLIFGILLLLFLEHSKKNFLLVDYWLIFAKQKPNYYYWSHSLFPLTTEVSSNLQRTGLGFRGGADLGPIHWSMPSAGPHFLGCWEDPEAYPEVRPTAPA